MQRQTYAQFYELEDKHWWFIATRAIVLDHVKRQRRNDHSVLLDAGCGTGGMMQKLLPLGEVYGIDNSKQALQFCAMRNLKNVALGSLEALPYKASQFDAIVLSDVIEHVEKDELGLQELARVLKPGGFMVVTVPAYPWLWSGHDEVHQHYRRYTKTELRDVLQRAGFSIQSITYYNGLLFPGILFVRGLKKLLKHTTSDLSLPPLWINALFTRIFLCERWFLRFLSLPFGVSLLCVVRKQT